MPKEIREPIDMIVVYSQRYNRIRIEVDSTAIDQQIALVTHRLGYNRNTPEDVVAASDYIQKVLSIKGVDRQNYIIGEFELGDNGKRYFVYQAYENKQERIIIDAFAQILQDNIAEAKRKVEAERQYIRDNPWPHKTVFRGEFYTRTAYQIAIKG